MKKYQYHNSYSFIDPDKNKVTMYSQVYQVGIYCCVEGGGPRMQLNLTPNEMIKVEKSLQKEFDKGIIKGLEFGSLVTVIEENGFYKQI